VDKHPSMAAAIAELAARRMRQMRQVIAADERRTIDAIVDGVAHTSELAMAVGDQKELSRLAKGFLRNDQIVFVAICPKQKCLVHLLRELRDTAQRNAAFGDGSFCRRLKRLIKEMLLLKKQKPKMSRAAYEGRGRRMEQRLEELARGSWLEPDEKRLAGRLLKFQKQLTVFLWNDAVEGTNNAAERALRPAVVMRKITGGSRSERGARATAVLMSVLRTARQQNRPLLETIKTLLMNAWAGKNPGFLTDVLADSS